MPATARREPDHLGENRRLPGRKNPAVEAGGSREDSGNRALAVLAATSILAGACATTTPPAPRRRPLPTRRRLPRPPQPPDPRRLRAAKPAAPAPAAAPRRDPRHRPRRPRPLRLGLRRPLPVRQRRLAEGQSHPGRPVLLGLREPPLRTEPREAPRGPREGRGQPGAPPGSDERRIGDFWASCMDEAAIEAAGAAADRRPSSRASRRSPRRPTSRPRSRGSRCSAPTPCSVSRAEQDRRKSTEVIALAAPGRTRASGPRLLHEDRRGVGEAARKVRGARGDGCSSSSATTPAARAANAKTVMAIETRLAEASMTPGRAPRLRRRPTTAWTSRAWRR